MQAEAPFLELEECPASSVPTGLVNVTAEGTAPVPTRPMIVHQEAQSDDGVGYV